MTRITLCTNDFCPKAPTCYRALSTKLEVEERSYGAFKPVVIKGEAICMYYERIEPRVSEKGTDWWKDNPHTAWYVQNEQGKISLITPGLWKRRYLDTFIPIRTKNAQTDKVLPPARQGRSA